MRLVNFGPPGERSKDGTTTTLEPAFPVSSLKRGENIKIGWLLLWSVVKNNSQFERRKLNRWRHISFYHDFSQPSASDFSKLRILSMVEDRPAVPDEKQTLIMTTFSATPMNCWVLCTCKPRWIASDWVFPKESGSLCRKHPCLVCRTCSCWPQTRREIRLTRSRFKIKTTLSG